MKLLLILFILSFSSLTSAQSCRGLIADQNPTIQTRIGSHWGTNPLSGGIYYQPGQQYTFTDREHWTFIFDSAIFYGSSSFASDTENKSRESLLKKFKKDIEGDCLVVKKQDQSDSYEVLRNIMKELVEDGSFCPNNKVLERPFLSPWSNYRKVLKDAVASGRFSEVCAGVATNTESSRIIKDVNDSTEISAPAGSGAQEQ